MNVRNRRPRRPDGWSDAHSRARLRAAERLEGPLDPSESTWLDDHLGSCAACRATAAAYAAQRLELRALADRPPVPPRDLWARTAAAIEREAAFRDRAVGRRSRRSSLAPYALLSAALVVAVVIGTLTSSQLFRPDGVTTASSSLPGRPSAETALGPGGSGPVATPLLVDHKVAWISQDSNGEFQITTTTVDKVCTDPSVPCPTTTPTEKRPVDLNGDAKTAISSPDGDQVVVFGVKGTSKTDTVNVVKLPPSPAPDASPSPSDTAVSTPVPSATTSAVPATPTIRPTPTATAIATPSSTPASEPPSSSPSPTVAPSVAVTPSASPDGTVQIAHDVIVVGQAASYSPSGTWFAFSARPSDGTAGPDIYVWRVGDAEAHPVTTDHRSELGSWSGDVIVGSTAVDTKKGTVGAAFLIDPATGNQTLLPQVGNAWRPSVDPNSRQAVYWTGRLRATSDGPGFAPDSGKLVLGAWDSVNAATSIETPSNEPSATAPPDQPNDRRETTIAAGQLNDWDARWDSTGTRLAVWIADATDPSFGRLSLYDVDPFDGRIELKKPLINARLAKAGYALSQGKLVWAEPAEAGGSGDGHIFLYAWTDKGSGSTTETVPGQVIVVR